MKKIIYLITAVLVIATTLSACNDNKKEQSGTSITTSNNTSTSSKPSDSSAAQSTEGESEAQSVDESKATSVATISTVSENEPAGALSESLLKTIKSGVYMLKIKELPSKLGDDLIYTDYTCYYKKSGIVVDKTQYGTTERTIILSDVVYSVNSELEMILKSKPGTFYDEQGLPKLEALTHYKDSVETISGVLYDIESFKDTDGNIVSFLYKNKQLKKLRSYIPSSEEYAEYDVEFKATYDNKVFDLPSDFEIIEFT